MSPEHSVGKKTWLVSIKNVEWKWILWTVQLKRSKVYVVDVKTSEVNERDRMGMLPHICSKTADSDWLCVIKCYCWTHLSARQHGARQRQNTHREREKESRRHLFIRSRTHTGRERRRVVGIYSQGIKGVMTEDSYDTSFRIELIYVHQSTRCK